MHVCMYIVCLHYFPAYETSTVGLALGVVVEILLKCVNNLIFVPEMIYEIID